MSSWALCGRNTVSFGTQLDTSRTCLEHVLRLSMGWRRHLERYGDLPVVEREMPSRCSIFPKRRMRAVACDWLHDKDAPRGQLRQPLEFTTPLKKHQNMNDYLPPLYIFTDF